MSSYSPWNDPQLSDGDFPQPKQNMEFKRGDILEFDPQGVYAAKKGAKAIYSGVSYTDRDGGELIEVAWVQDGLANSQNDGEYFKHMFTKSEEQSFKNENRILKEKKDMKTFNFEKGKTALIHYFDYQFEMAEEGALMCIHSMLDMNSIGKEVESFSLYERDHIHRVVAIKNALTLKEIFDLIEDTNLENDDEVIIDFFMHEEDEKNS
jgi:hypothetical protein